MKKYLCAAALFSVMALNVGGAAAEELWNPHLRGASEGLAAGALPPAGVYLINETYMGTWKAFNGSGKATGSKLDLLVDIPIILWNPGVKIWGADYAVGIAQPFDYTSVYSDYTAAKGNGHMGTFNTILIPAQLSWTLPENFHVKAGLLVLADDASSSPAHPAPAGGAGAGNSFWTLEPELAASWLQDGWNLSVDFHYDYNLKDSATDYQSGDQIAVDYTATKTIGKWTVGAGAYQENQLARDTIKGVSTSGTTRLTYGAGPIVGYNFGSVNLSATYNVNIMTHNDFGGDFLNIRLTAPLY